MKYIGIIFLILLSTTAKSQNHIHWLINKDPITNCRFIRSGKFVHEKTNAEITEGYSIEFRGSIVIEKVNNGKYFLKSKIHFTSKCSYTSTVLETNIPGYEDTVGKTFFTEILETAKTDKLIKIRSKGDEWSIFVLRKIEN